MENTKLDLSNGEDTNANVAEKTDLNGDSEGLAAEETLTPEKDEKVEELRAAMVLSEIICVLNSTELSDSEIVANILEVFKWHRLDSCIYRD